jgi:hypothetical protein
VNFPLGETDQTKWQRCSCLPGTKIQIHHLLKSFPVRSQMYKGTVRKVKAKRSQQGHKIVSLCRAFALFHPAGTIGVHALVHSRTSSHIRSLADSFSTGAA